MSRAFCVPAVFFIFSAFALLFIVSVSLPYLPAVDITRVHANGTVEVGGEKFIQLRLGLWSDCLIKPDGNTACSPTSHGYSVIVESNAADAVTIGSSWTLGLAIHPVACGVSFIALLLSFSQHITFTLLASLVSFLAATLALISFAVDLALFVYFKNQMGNLGFGDETITGPGFWLTFAAMILLVVAGLTVCCGRRRHRMASATTFAPRGNKTGFMSRFRRN